MTRSMAGCARAGQAPPWDEHGPAAPHTGRCRTAPECQLGYGGQAEAAGVPMDGDGHQHASARLADGAVAGPPQRGRQTWLRARTGAFLLLLLPLAFVDQPVRAQSLCRVLPGVRCDGAGSAAALISAVARTGPSAPSGGDAGGAILVPVVAPGRSGPACVASPGANAARRLFSSGFEGVSLGAPRWGWQDIIGTDRVTGQDWSEGFWSGIRPRLQLRAGAFTTEIRTVIGPHGERTRALYQAVNSVDASGSQIPLVFQPRNRMAEQRELYTSLRIMFQPDLSSQLVPGPLNGLWGNWRQVWAFKTGGDYRIQIVVMMGSDRNLFWRAQGDNDANGPYRYQMYWQSDNTSMPVVAGAWIRLETFTHRSAGQDGRFWVAVDGRTIVDRRGPNMGVANLPIDRLFLPTVYTNGHVPAYQWVDDIEIWEGMPACRRDPRRPSQGP